ncbi:MAG: hypothetical protein AB8B63_01725 [Granulosicoccus sp.]
MHSYRACWRSGHYTISVPIARFEALKEKIDDRINWQPIDCGAERDCDAFEEHWQPESSGEDRARRFLFIRQFNTKKQKTLIQLDLLEPISYDFDFEIVITNRKDSLARSVVLREKRGSQEGIFAEIKSRF